MARLIATPADIDWRADTSIAYAILRLTLGANIVFFVVLALRSWNVISLDRWIASNKAKKP